MKKIVIGSILIVLMLNLLSFYPVIGVDNGKQIKKLASSPLFAIRTCRAKDKVNKDLTFNYIGKDKESTIFFQKRDNKTVLLQKFIERLYQMNEETFEKFVTFIRNQVYKNRRFRNVNVNAVIESIYLLRDDKSILKFKSDTDNKYPLTFITEDCCWPTISNCLLLTLLLLIALPIILILVFIATRIYAIFTIIYDCYPTQDCLY